LLISEGFTKVFHAQSLHADIKVLEGTELSVLTRQCLSRRIADAATLTQEVALWQERRNRLRRLYPHPDDDPLAVHRAGCPDQAASAVR